MFNCVYRLMVLREERSLKMASTAMTSVKYLQRAAAALPPLAYVKLTGNSGAQSPGIVYIGGYMSNMDGEKAKQLQEFAAARHLPFLRFDYTYLGKSVDSNNAAITSDTRISFDQWRRDVLTVIDELTEGPQILVGSSMGGWMSLLTTMERPQRVAGIVTISLAVGFVSRLVHLASAEEKQRLFTGQTIVHSDPKTRMTTVLNRDLIAESTAFDLRNVAGTLPIRCPVKCIHALHDPVAPYQDMLTIVDKLDTDDVDILIMSTADHRMESKIEVILAAVEEMLVKHDRSKI